MQAKQLLPVLFYVDCYENVPDTVHFFDPAGNVFIIAIKQKRNRLFLHRGCTRIGEVYSLFEGGWISITSMRGTTYSMRVSDRMLNQVTYPSPPRRFGLGEQGMPITIRGGDAHAFTFVDSIHFDYCFVKRLTDEDINSPTLVCTCILFYNHYSLCCVLVYLTMIKLFFSLCSIYLLISAALLILLHPLSLLW